MSDFKEDSNILTADHQPDGTLKLFVQVDENAIFLNKKTGQHFVNVIVTKHDALILGILTSDP